MADKQSRQKRSHEIPNEEIPPAKREHLAGTKRARAELSDSEEEENGVNLSQLSVVSTRDEALKLKTAADIGILERVELFNFMCHEHLQLDINPNVNFILGRNGSGKSAIMTGIVVGLGGKARSTERGSSLKQFVRTGASCSRVVVQLRNRGNDAFKSNEYGDSIICERSIRDDGTSQYKIKSEQGKVISTKKDELVALTDHCGIQIDNPVSLLNQDTARNFLHSSKPADKYKLFMKATRLEQIANDYSKSKEELTTMDLSIKKIGSSLPDKKAECKKLEEQVASFEKFSGMEKKIVELENELKWAIVFELEATIPPIESDVRKETARIDRNEERIRVAKELIKEAQDSIKKSQSDLKNITDEMKQAGAGHRTIASEKRIKGAEIRENRTALQNINKKISTATKDKAALEKAKQDSIIASQRDVKGEREARMREISELEEQVHRVESEVSTAEGEKIQFQSALKRTEGQMSSHKEKQRAVSGYLRDCRDQLERLKSSSGDNLMAFGRDMRALVTALHRNRNKFRHPPKGPVGSMISLKDYKWSTAVEQTIKFGMLKAFVVDNQADAQTYKNIARSVWRNGFPEVIVSQFQGSVYDVSRSRPRCEYPTIFEMLNVSDPDVMNVLIDQCSVETTVLIEDRATANRVVDRERKAPVAYTLSGDQVLPGRHYSNKRKSFGIIKDNLDSAIRAQETELGNLEAQKRQLEAMAMSLKREHETNNRHVVGLSEKIRRKLGEKKKFTMKLNQLNMARDEEEPQEDIATYEAEIAELEEQIAVGVQERTAQEEVLTRLNRELIEINNRSRAADSNVEQLAARNEEIKDCMRDGEHKKSQAERKLKTYQDKLTEINTTIATLKSNIETQKSSLREAINIAENGCDRVDHGKSRRTITSEINSLKKCVTEDQPSLEEQEAVKKRYNQAMEDFSKQRSSQKALREAMKEMKKSLDLRVENFERVQNRVIQRAKYFFTFLLQQRDYDGKLKFDHDKEILEIAVQTDSHTVQSQATSDTKQLSGGERSFTTVCFIMALWDAIEAPFRCLDEFDVFMDMINRRISMRMMLQMAEDKPMRQFLFFTPQDMSSMGISGSKNVKVLRLPEPVRGDQRRLTDYTN